MTTQALQISKHFAKPKMWKQEQILLSIVDPSYNPFS